jgi:coproporphyrinogen III oxidase
MSNIEEVDQFLQDTEKRFSAFCGALNVGMPVEKRSWDSPLGDIRTTISRGDIFEKASAVYCNIEIDTPPVLYEKMKHKEKKMQALVLEIGIHPFNPHIPKSYLELRANSAGEVILAGGTDIFPYFQSREDNDLFADKIRSKCDTHGVDYEALRKVRIDFFKSKYTKENVGAHAGIYFFQLAPEKFSFFKDMTDAFFEAYQALIETHKDEPVSAEDKAHQQMLHGKWAQWIMVEDEGTRFGLEMGIPPEALLGAILPPVATY